MKELNKIIILFLALVLFTGCEDLTDLNKDPNRPTEVPVEYLLTSAERQLGNRLYGTFDNVAFGMTIAQYWAQNEYSDEVRYQYRAATNNTFWTDFYTAINDLEEIKRINETIEKGAIGVNQNAVATILQSWAYHNLVDIYGDIPYTDALKGVESPSPVYSTQEDVYSDLIAKVSEAVSQIDPSVDGFQGGDVIFNNDLTKWVKFGNSLLLRMGMRISEVNPTLAQSTVSAAAGNVISSNADNAALQYITAQPNVNPLFVSYIVDGRADYCGTENFIDLLNGLTDPRIGEYFLPAVETGTFVGLEYGVPSAVAAGINRDAVSQLNPQVYAADFEGMFMDYAETSFLLAEAASLGWVSGGTAETYYSNGVTASMNYWNIDDATAISAYIAANPYSADNLALQKYIASYTQGWQAWAEIRRLDIENIAAANLKVYEPSENFIGIAGIPRRREYPQDEQNLNGANYEAASSSIGGDEYSTNLFWDVD